MKGGDNMCKCNDCEAPQVSCEECEYNQGFDPSTTAGHIAGPCGQQNCWYSCTVCEYNDGLYHADE